MNSFAQLFLVCLLAHVIRFYLGLRLLQYLCMFGCSGFLMLKWLTITTVYVSVFSVWYLVLVVVADRFLKIMLIKKQLQLLSDLLFQYVRVWSIKKGQFIRKGTMKSHSLNSPQLVVSFCMVVTRVKLKQYHNSKNILCLDTFFLCNWMFHKQGGI